MCIYHTANAREHMPCCSVQRHPIPAYRIAAILALLHGVTETGWQRC